MTPRIAASVLAIAAALAPALPARADVTADQVWAAWKALAQSSGQTMTGSESRAGDALRVTDLAVTSDGADGTTVNVALGDVTFDEQGDGTVAIRMPETHPLTVTVRDGNGKETVIGFTVRQPGFRMVASGTPDRLVQDFEGPEVGLTLDRLTAEGAPPDAKVDVTLENLAGSYVQTQGAPRRIESRFSADTMRFDVAATDATEGTRITMQGTAHQLASASDSRVPQTTGTQALGKMLEAGFASQGTLTYGAVSYQLDVLDKGKPTHAEASANAGSLDFALGGTGMDYDVRAEDTRVALSGADIPFPQLELTMAESGFHFQMPLVQTDTPADFALATKLSGVTVSDELWGMFDPTGQLPRDPATLILDVTGKARWLADITDPAMAASDDVPAELKALNVKDLKLDVAGADLTGSGAFTFDNADKTTFEGMPRPEGKLSLRLEGANALMDKLVAMGLIPQDQAMGMRMMLGMFARPAEGPDAMVSVIEINDQGQVLANGQRLR